MRLAIVPILWLAIIVLAIDERVAAQGLPARTFEVKPVGELPVRRGRFFMYVLPTDWTVGEDGQYALTLIAPDQRAFTLMVGNAAMPLNYPLDRFAWEKMLAIQPRDLRFGQPAQAVPAAGFKFAYEFDVSYVSARGIPSRGRIKCNVLPAYDSELIVMTGAFAVEAQWPSYAGWLPQTAQLVSAVDGAAFGARGAMAQNLRMSEQYGNAARAYRDWSQRNWQATTDQRNEAIDRRNHEVRQNLGSTREYANPFDAGVTVDLPLTYKYYWANPDGTYVGTDDPNVDPNVGSNVTWKLMAPHRSN